MFDFGIKGKPRRGAYGYVTGRSVHVDFRCGCRATVDGLGRIAPYAPREHGEADRISRRFKGHVKHGNHAAYLLACQHDRITRAEAEIRDARAEIARLKGGENGEA